MLTEWEEEKFVLEILLLAQMAFSEIIIYLLMGFISLQIVRVLYVALNTEVFIRSQKI